MFYKLKTVLKKLIKIIVRYFGLKLLDQAQTNAFLYPSLVKDYPQNHVKLQGIENCANSGGLVFKEKEAVTNQVCVWIYNCVGQQVRQFRHGGIVINSKVLCMDFDQAGFYKSLVKRNKRSFHAVKTVIAPWSQYMDGFKFVGYYDFVFLIAAKLCRIKECVSADEFSKAIISYPLLGTSYEQEYLELLGKKKTDVLDSRYNNIKFEKVILANMGHWSYPNVADVFAFKKYVENKLQVKKINQNRIYVSRSGRRRIKNEKELIELLRKFDFIVIEDKLRSVFEQVEIYKNASFIIGPHGASFTNIIWCEPGTHLFELFSPNFVPDYFLYIATIMGIKYSAYYDPEREKACSKNYKKNMVEDIFVSIPELEKSLLSLL